MRSDMAKVVTERPRSGSAARSAKTGHRLSWNEVEQAIMTDDAGPSRHPVSRRRQYDDPKSFTDVLGPLRGYLRKQVGRPWNDVFSELSRTLDRRSITGLHIWDHVQWEVTLHAHIAADGTVWTKRRYWSEMYQLDRDDLYVHPVDGLLKAATKNASRRYRYRKPKTTKIDLAPDCWLDQVEGIWYRFDRRTWMEATPERRNEAGVVTQAAGQRPMSAVTKRQLGRKDLRTHGLKNAA